MVNSTTARQCYPVTIMVLLLMCGMLYRAASAEPIVRIRLETTTADGNYTPISRAELGEEFMLRAFVQDARGFFATGVFAAYIDVEYSDSAVSVVVPAEDPAIDHGTIYTNGQSGNVNTSGVIDEAGGFADGQQGQGGEEFLLWQVRFSADDLGTFSFASNEA